MGQLTKVSLILRNYLEIRAPAGDALIIPPGIVYIERVIVNHPLTGWEVPLGKLRETCYRLRLYQKSFFALRFDPL